MVCLLHGEVMANWQIGIVYNYLDGQSQEIDQCWLSPSQECGGGGDLARYLYFMHNISSVQCPSIYCGNGTIMMH